MAIKDIFLELQTLLKNNISELNNRVYAAYPKKKAVFPLCVIETSSLKPDTRSCSNNILTQSYSFIITLYASSAEDCDNISEEIVNTLMDNFSLDCDLTLSMNKTMTASIDNKIIHQAEIEAEVLC